MVRHKQATARTCPPGDWVRFEAEVKAPLRARVGWHAPDDAPAALRTSEAYEAVYAVLAAAFEAPARRRAA